MLKTNTIYILDPSDPNNIILLFYIEIIVKYVYIIIHNFTYTKKLIIGNFGGLVPKRVK